jgi:hypothetical protein
MKSDKQENLNLLPEISNSQLLHEFYTLNRTQAYAKMISCQLEQGLPQMHPEYM